MNRNILKRSLLNQAGQGITEYILLLIIIVAMVLGGMYQLNTAFEKWANNYFGEYLACLLETGELPSIGGAPGDSGICNQLFKPFNLADGRRLTPEPGDGDGDGGGDDGDGDPSYTENRPRGGTGSGDGVRETASPSRGSYISSGSSMGRSGQFNSSQRGQNISRNQKEKAKYTGSTESSLPAGAGYTENNSRAGRPKYIAITGRRIIDVEKKEAESTQQSGSIQRDPTSQESNKKIKVLRKTAKEDVALEDEPMTFGNFLRLLIIAAIIIALVLLLGGQALQISKDSE